MIVIDYRPDGLTMTGHAGFAEYGEDIVCAGISALVQTLVEAVEELTDDELQYEISAGYVDVKHEALTERAQVLFDAFLIGVEMIAESYPENVELCKH